MSYVYNEDIINEVRDKSNIVDTISKSINLKKIGYNYKGLCPFHSEKTPSFTVSEEKQIFNCFGCGEGGDVFTFLMKHENIEFIDALKILADDTNVMLEKKNINLELEKTKDILYEINREAARHFYRNLFNDRRAYSYLIGRGIDKETIKTFGVGYARDSWSNLLDYLKSKDYKEEDIEKAGLITYSKKTERYFDKFRGRIIFPIINTRDNIIGFGGRSIDNANQPKYLNTPETPVFSKRNNLYGLNIVKKHSKSDKVILVEGYMDVISLYKYGIVNSVASLGTALTESQVGLLKRYKEIYVCYDSDIAGKNATIKAINVMKNLNISPKIIPLPENLDPDDFIKKHSVSEFENLMNNALTSIEFKIEQKKNAYDISNYEDKINFLKDVSTLLREIKSPVEAEVYIDKISKETNIPSQAIKQEVNKNLVTKTPPSTPPANNFKFNKSNNYNNFKPNNREIITPVMYMLKPAHLTAEKELLNIIINNKDIYQSIKDKFKPEDFLEPIYRKLAEIAYDAYEINEELDGIEVVDEFEDDEKLKIKEVFSLNININKDVKAIEDYIKNINYYKINMKKENIKKQLNEIEKMSEKTEQDVETFNRLCLELLEIDKSLKMN